MYNLSNSNAYVHVAFKSKNMYLCSIIHYNDYMYADYYTMYEILPYVIFTKRVAYLKKICNLD